MAHTKLFYMLAFSLAVSGCFLTTQTYAQEPKASAEGRVSPRQTAPQQKPRGDSSVTEPDYEKCVSFCNDKFPGNSQELTECIKGCSKVEGAAKVWTIRTAETVKPDLRKLLDGQQVREGLNLVGTSPQGVKISVRVVNGELTELVFTDEKGRTETHGRAPRTMARRVGPGEVGGVSSQQCVDQYDRCLDECRARGGWDEYLCNLACGWDFAMCLRGVGIRASGDRISIWLR